MSFRFTHNSINVSDLEKSMAFYQQALGLQEMRRLEREGYTLVFMGDGVTDWRLELTWLHDHPQPYDLGENEIHIGLVTEDFDAAFKKHSEMGCICYDNAAMGLYFIQDPDGYWIEILPVKK